jgi:hypothetical protein
MYAKHMPPNELLGPTSRVASGMLLPRRLEQERESIKPQAQIEVLKPTSYAALLGRLQPNNAFVCEKIAIEDLRRIV